MSFYRELNIRRRPSRWCVMVGIALVVTSACKSEHAPPNGNLRAISDREAESTSETVSATQIRFEDVAKAANISFTYHNDEEQERASILEVVGGGVALVDYDLDGRLDLFLPGGGQYVGQRELKGESAALFRQEDDWQFANVAEIARAADSRYYSHGVAAADCNDDGFPDLLVTGYAGLTLLLNCGDGTFHEAPSDCGLADVAWPTSAGWGDLDQDGALDLFVVQYLNWSFDNDPPCFSKSGKKDWCSPQTFQPLPNKLFLNNRDGSFRDASATYELRNNGKGLGVVLADVDLDRDLDIYVANDTTENFLYRNDEGRKLTEIGLQSGSSLDKTGSPDGSMGVDVGDFNGDGQPDLWVVNFEQEIFALYQNIGNGLFLHATDATGLAAESGLYVGWGTTMRDFDRDSDLDLFVTTGHAFRFPSHAPRKQRMLLFESHERRRFQNVAQQASDYSAAAHDGRGLAAGDIDNDGLIDVGISHLNEPVALLRNRTVSKNHWLGLRLIGRNGSRDAIGAVVRLKTGMDTQVAQVTGGGSYLSTSDQRLLFGLKDSDRIESVSIDWPSGHQQTLMNIAIDQYHTVVENK